MPYWEITIPLLAETVILTLRYVALGEFIPYAEITAWFEEKFSSAHDEDEHDGRGDHSNSFLHNLDSMILLAVALVAILLFVGALALLKRKFDSV